MRQLALDIRLADHAVFGNFHPGGNELAVATVRAMAGGEPPAAAWLWGQADTGKSHLLQAAVALAHERGWPTGYLPLANLAQLPPTVLGGMGALRLLALDDIGAVAGKDAWERALLQLFEQLMAGGGRLLVAAAAPPAASGIVLADLRSRLAAGAVFRMEPLAEADCRQALQRRAEWRGFSLPDETADFLLTRVGRGTGSLFGLLDRLDQAALVAQRRLTIPFVRSVLQSGG
ncbi:MAG: DnaA regulatory inactivator Hda [Gammaproteobacteria bacterium]|nr:DnaA regulatory inactivator Hda [Gammaproteobacteria bacterium]